MNIGKENEIIEFKKTTAEVKEGLQSISAILNKHLVCFRNFKKCAINFVK